MQINLPDYSECVEHGGTIRNMTNLKFLNRKLGGKNCPTIDMDHRPDSELLLVKFGQKLKIAPPPRPTF